ncbi:DUF6114 domain-containing protein [Streptomyces sp. NPDC085931]|uniref:DUF6114 domain-containing protein n=1 Tax=Streptomyces sp. NPDC085931 TaxID=3365740 RepID=UPI0037D820EE
MLLTTPRSRRPGPAARRRLAAWSSTRPCGSALLIITGGTWMIALPLLGTPMALLQPGVAASTGLGVSLPLALCGLVALRFPLLHGVAGVAAVGLAVLALITCNLGGLLLGTMFGVLGGCLAFSWTPPPPASAPRAPTASGPRA